MAFAHHTTGAMHMFDFEPGDGMSYRVLFGRMPPMYPYGRCYVFFGFAEQSDALITVVLNGNQLTAQAFQHQWSTATFTHPASGPEDITQAAYAVFATLVGQPGVEPPVTWGGDWRDRLPPPVLG